MDLEIIIFKWSMPNRERQILHDSTYMWNLKKKKDKNDLIYKAKIKPHTEKTNLSLLKGRERGIN